MKRALHLPLAALILAVDWTLRHVAPSAPRDALDAPVPYVLTDEATPIYDALVAARQHSARVELRAALLIETGIADEHIEDWENELNWEEES